MEKEPRRRTREGPDLGPITPQIIELFDHAVQGGAELRQRIKMYEMKIHPSIRDLLVLMYLRNQLSFIDPPLAAKEKPNGTNVWRYWGSHDEEFQNQNALKDEIISYLTPPERAKEAENRAKLAMHELIGQDRFTLLALYPIVEEMYKSPKGRPVARRHIAAAALQMKISTNWSWTKITNELCDCSKPKHDKHCKESLRQSVITLKALFRRQGLKVSSL
jgi:hypothetical protein